MLADRGHTATQSTISRDLKVLGATRILREDGNFAYHLRSALPGPFPSDMVTSIEHNESMIVIRTRVGRAQAVGIEIDAMRHPDILGTLAGDDTVLVIARSTTLTRTVAGRLRDLAGLVDPPPPEL